jgi:hypothetical protein
MAQSKKPVRTSVSQNPSRTPTSPSTAEGQLAEEIVAHPLFPVLLEAIQQTLVGKGVRHGGGETPFLEQPWAHYHRMHGRGFLTGQAAKKLEEAAHQRTGQLFETEVLGAIVYAGMAILKERETCRVVDDD